MGEGGSRDWMKPYGGRVTIDALVELHFTLP